MILVVVVIDIVVGIRQLGIRLCLSAVKFPVECISYGSLEGEVVTLGGFNLRE